MRFCECFPTALAMLGLDTDKKGKFYLLIIDRCKGSLHWLQYIRKLRRSNLYSFVLFKIFSYLKFLKLIILLIFCSNFRHNTIIACKITKYLRYMQIWKPFHNFFPEKHRHFPEKIDSRHICSQSSQSSQIIKYGYATPAFSVFTPYFWPLYYLLFGILYAIFPCV